MNQASRLSTAVAAAATLGLLIACQNGVSGPSLSATVTPPPTFALQPSLAGQPTVCCCHVVGNVTNTSSVTVHVQLAFPASVGGQSAGAAYDFQKDIKPGEVRPFLAAGIYAPCSQLTTDQIFAGRQIQITGLYQPAQ
jgi:hypothetical protein